MRHYLPQTSLKLYDLKAKKSFKLLIPN